MIDEHEGLAFTPLTRPATTMVGGIPALQLGAQFLPVPESISSRAKSGAWAFFAIRLSPSFCSDVLHNRFRVEKARLDFVLSQDQGYLAAYDIYPRFIEETRESDLELVLGSDLTWGEPSQTGAKFVYKTKFRRVHAYVVGTGIGADRCVWEFRKRRETGTLAGTVELFLVLQAKKGISIRGEARVEADIGFGRRPAVLVSAFDVGV